MKDPATALGIGLAFAFILVANILEGGNPMHMLLLPPMLLVFGGTIGVTIAGGTMADIKTAAMSAKWALTAKVASSVDLIPTIVDLASIARKDGLLALEDKVRTLNDPFLIKGTTMAVDGTDPEDLREILEAEVHAKRLRDRQAAKFFTDAGGYAPTIGIVGTVLSLVHVLGNLSKPDELGHMIAAAFLATLWGVLSANTLWLPIAAKLQRLSELQLSRMDVIIEGVCAIQAGSNPRVVAQKLQSLLPEDVNDEVRAA